MQRSYLKSSCCQLSKASPQFEHVTKQGAHLGLLFYFPLLSNIVKVYGNMSTSWPPFAMLLTGLTDAVGQTLPYTTYSLLPRVCEICNTIFCIGAEAENV